MEPEKTQPPTAPERPDQITSEPSPKPDNRKILAIIIAVVVGLAVLGWIGNLVMSRMAVYGLKRAFEAETGVSVDERAGVVTFRDDEGAEVRIETDDEGGTMTYTTEAGEQGTIEVSGGEGEASLPSNFPDDFPIMPGIRLEGTFSSSSEGRSGFTLSWISDASVDAIAEFYGDALPDAGWAATGSMDMAGIRSLDFSRNEQEDGTKDSATLMISRDEESGETNINLWMEIATP
ncbi:hypothetical protein AMJ57_02270 [Parcubacteria bacterium SG8_24]|nr:MAG: hypothetical protein AMJ57_02270 [Parcubacteria bacterium SG8_24]